MNPSEDHPHTTSASTEATKKLNPGVIVAAVLGVAILGIVAVTTFRPSSSTESMESSERPAPELVSPSAPPTNAAVQVNENTTESDKSEAMQQESTVYQDGTYEAVGNYTSPGGSETIGISVTIEKGLITDASAQPQAKIQASQRFQSQFADNFREQVIGQPLETLSLNKVAGSSLTPKGFNDALETIRTQAQG